MLGRLIPPIPTKVEIRKPTRVPDGQGGFERGWATASTCRGRIRPLSGDESMLADRQGVHATHSAYLPPDVDIHEEDRLRSGGVDYEVRWVRKPGGFEHHVQVLLLEVS